jgi:hypothetical protein
MARRPRSSELVLAGALALAGCGHRRADPAPAALDVPVARGTILVDGKQEGPDWNGVALREVFTSGDAEARPHSEARFVRDGRNLYVGLYAADEDIRSTDAFDVTLGVLAMHVDVRGRVTPAPPPGVRVAVDVDDETTIDVPSDFDEEWKVMLAIPLDEAGLHGSEPSHVHVARCDTPKDGVTRCGAWDGVLVARP